RHLHNLPLSHSPFGNGCSCLECCLMSHAIEPVGKQSRRINGRSLADENEKSGLEGVLGVGVGMQDTAAHPPEPCGHAAEAPPQTIGPCRRTSAPRAASSRRRRYSTSNCPSVIPAPSCSSAARRRW